MTERPMNVAEVALDPFTNPISGAELRNHALSVAISRHARVETVAIRPFCVNRGELSLRRHHRTVKHFSPALAKRVLDAILASDPQVVLLEGVDLLELAEMLCQQGRHPLPRLVFDFHNVESCLLQDFDLARFPRCLRSLASTFYGRSWQYARQAEIRAAELADQVWVCSEADATRMATLLGTEQLRSKLRVVPNVVPLWCQQALEQELSARTNAAEPWRALFLGHLRYPPNVRAVDQLLSDIWPAVHARYPQLQLIIAGRRPSKAMRRRVGRAAGVHLEANPTDLEALYRDVDLVIVPLDQGGGSRLKILEALALGKPVIATDKAVEGLNLVADKHWLPAHQSQEFVDQVGRLIEDATLRHQLASAGRELVRSQYSCQAIAQPIHEMLLSLQLPNEGRFEAGTANFSG